MHRQPHPPPDSHNPRRNLRCPAIVTKRLCTSVSHTTGGTSTMWQVTAGKTAGVSNDINDGWISAGQSLVLLLTPVGFYMSSQNVKKADRNTVTVWPQRGDTAGFHRQKLLAAQTTWLTSAPTPKITIQVFTQWFLFSLSLCVPPFIVFALLHCDQSLQLCPAACWVTQSCGSAVGPHRAPSTTACLDAAYRTQFTLRPVDLHCWQQPELEATNYHHIQCCKYSPAQHDHSEMTSTVYLHITDR